MKEDFFLLLMISKHWTGTFFPGKSDFVDFTTHLNLHMNGPASNSTPLRFY